MVSASTAASAARCGAVLGAVLITVISNSLNMLGVSFFVSLIVKGIVIITFVAFDDLRRRERS